MLESVATKFGLFGGESIYQIRNKLYVLYTYGREPINLRSRDPDKLWKPRRGVPRLILIWWRAWYPSLVHLVAIIWEKITSSSNFRCYINWQSRVPIMLEQQPSRISRSLFIYLRARWPSLIRLVARISDKSRFCAIFGASMAESQKFGKLESLTDLNNGGGASRYP